MKFVVIYDSDGFVYRVETGYGDDVESDVVVANSKDEAIKVLESIGRLKKLPRVDMDKYMIMTAVRLLRAAIKLIDDSNGLWEVPQLDLIEARKHIQVFIDKIETGQMG